MEKSTACSKTMAEVVKYENSILEQKKEHSESLVLI